MLNIVIELYFAFEMMKQFEFEMRLNWKRNCVRRENRECPAGPGPGLIRLKFSQKKRRISCKICFYTVEVDNTVVSLFEDISGRDKKIGRQDLKTTLLLIQSALSRWQEK